MEEIYNLCFVVRRQSHITNGNIASENIKCQATIVPGLSLL